MRIAFILIILIPFASWTQNTGFEVHWSVNHPLAVNRKNMSGTVNENRTFFGVGIGGNILFRDTNRFSFKTGLEVNYFHTWDPGVYVGQMGSQKNVHYQYVVLSFPAFARLTFGDRFKFFVEAGVYAGICLGGQMKSTNTSYGMSPNDPTVTETRTDSYYSGLSITPAIGIGARFPLSERMDLFLKPEFAFMKNNLEKGPAEDWSYGGDIDFNASYAYVRLSVGIHLK